ncbi:MAG: hypothetical protein GF398_00415 [Chitinivibrionales bacterium]|nr:hypothetical protein [Chitinivibrionales bacterium]
MKSTRKTAPATILCALALFAASCTSTTQVSDNGSGTTTGNPAVAARMLVADIEPARGAHVYLRPRTYLALDDTLAHARYHAAIRNGSTGAQGEFVFDSIPPGAYLLEVNNGAGLARLFAFTISDSDTLVDLGDQLLLREGALRGSVQTARSRLDSARVLVYGLERSVGLTTDGDFTIPAPQGVHALYIEEPEGAYVSGPLTNIAVAAADTNDLGTISVDSCPDGRCDSATVEEFIRRNSLAGAGVDDIATANAAGRVLALRASGLGVSVLPASVGRLLQLGELDVANNKLDSLPPQLGRLARLQYFDASKNILTGVPVEIGNLTRLQELRLHHNALTQVPASVGNLTNLKKCYLSENDIDTLPDEIINLTNLSVFSISNNKLCAVPVAVEHWLDANDPDWSTNQHCSP